MEKKLIKNLHDSQVVSQEKEARASEIVFHICLDRVKKYGKTHDNKAIATIIRTEIGQAMGGRAGATRSIDEIEGNVKVAKWLLEKKNEQFLVRLTSGRVQVPLKKLRDVCNSGKCEEFEKLMPNYPLDVWRNEKKSRKSVDDDNDDDGEKEKDGGGKKSNKK